MIKLHALKVLNEALKQDIGFMDITTELLDDKEIKAYIVAKEPCILCGINFIKEFFEQHNVKGKVIKPEGSFCEGKVLELYGSSKTILTLERTALNLLMHLSGVATKTYKLIKKVREVNKKVRIAGTRKTLPLLSPLQKYAILLAGGDPHRFRLDDSILIKDNHIDILGLREAIRRAKRFSFTKKIEVEVRNFEELRMALEEKVDIVMLDNFSPEEIEEALKIVKSYSYRPIIEVSGEINEDNILEYAKYDIDVISLGSLTHSVKAIDFSLYIEPLTDK
ncbi:carboxylating nicotinate-nucleotide diphosphorylase [Methanocaldococcus infernus]